MRSDFKILYKLHYSFISLILTIIVVNIFNDKLYFIILPAFIISLILNYNSLKYNSNDSNLLTSLKFIIINFHLFLLDLLPIPYFLVLTSIIFVKVISDITLNRNIFYLIILYIFLIVYKLSYYGLMMNDPDVDYYDKLICIITLSFGWIPNIFLYIKSKYIFKKVLLYSFLNTFIICYIVLISEQLSLNNIKYFLFYLVFYFLLFLNFYFTSRIVKD